MKKTIAAMIVAVLMVGLMGTAATAKSGVGVLVGTAQVGQGWVEPCTKQVAPATTGRGLAIPNPENINTNLQRVYSLNTAVTAVTENGAINSGAVNICGHVKGVGGGSSVPVTVGGSCGMSKGYDGIGKIRWTTGKLAGSDTLLNDVGWKWSVGGLFVVKGRTDTVPAGSKTKGSGKPGKLIAVVAAHGSGCPDFAGAGATTFQVEAVTAIVQGIESIKGYSWNDKPLHGKPGPIWKAKP